jgi:tetratricopeptide (TPR) repeat protein
MAEGLDHPFSVSAAQAALGRVHLRRGDFERAAAMLESALAICETAQLPLLYPFAASPLGAAYARLGRMPDALPLLEQAVERAAAMRRMVDQSLWMYWQSEAVLLDGRQEEGTELAARALHVAATHKERGYEAWILRLLGDVHAQQGPPAFAGAEQHYRQSLAIAESLGMRPLVARCCLSLGELQHRQGRSDAPDTLRTAYAMCREMEMTYWLHHVEAALERAGAPPTPPPEEHSWTTTKNALERSVP